MRYSLSPSLSPTRRKELAGLLDLNGAAPHPPYTHLIVLPASHAHNDATNDPTVKVVTDRWVDRSIVLGKCQPCVSFGLFSPVVYDRRVYFLNSSEQYYSPDPAMIFSGVVACATDVCRARVFLRVMPHITVILAFCTRLGGPVGRYHRTRRSMAHRSHPRRYPSFCPPTR